MLRQRNEIGRLKNNNDKNEKTRWTRNDQKEKRNKNKKRCACAFSRTCKIGKYSFPFRNTFMQVLRLHGRPNPLYLAHIRTARFLVRPRTSWLVVKSSRNRNGSVSETLFHPFKNLIKSSYFVIISVIGLLCMHISLCSVRYCTIVSIISFNSFGVFLLQSATTIKMVWTQWKPIYCSCSVQFFSTGTQLKTLEWLRK